MDVRRFPVIIALVLACDSSSSEVGNAPDSGVAAPAAVEMPDADSFEITILNRCADRWRFYVSPAAEAGDASAGPSAVVPAEAYTVLEPGRPLTQRLSPGDVVWFTNQRGESTATGFQSKAEGEGGRIEVNPDCEGIRRVRIAPA